MGDIWLPFDSYVSSPAKLALVAKKEGSSCGETPSGHIASFASVRVPSPAPCFLLHVFATVFKTKNPVVAWQLELIRNSVSKPIWLTIIVDIIAARASAMS